MAMLNEHPHIIIHDRDNTTSNCKLISTRDGIIFQQCDRTTKFDKYTTTWVIVDYVTDCLKKDTAYSLSTNVGTANEEVDATKLHQRLYRKLEYITAMR